MIKLRYYTLGGGTKATQISREEFNYGSFFIDGIEVCKKISAAGNEYWTERRETKVKKAKLKEIEVVSNGLKTQYFIPHEDWVKGVHETTWGVTLVIDPIDKLWYKKETVTAKLPDTIKVSIEDAMNYNLFTGEKMNLEDVYFYKQATVANGTCMTVKSTVKSLRKVKLIVIDNDVKLDLKNNIVHESDLFWTDKSDATLWFEADLKAKVAEHNKFRVSKELPEKEWSDYYKLIKVEIQV